MIIRTVGGEQRNFDTSVFNSVGYVLHIFLIVAVTAVFILNLNENNVSAARNLMRGESRDKLVEISVDKSDITLVHTADIEVVIL